MSSAEESGLDYVNTGSRKKSKTMDSQTQEIESSDEYDLTDEPKTKKTPRKSLLQDPDHSQLFDKLMKLEHGYAEFKTWKDQDNCFQQILAMLKDSEQAQAYWDIAVDKARKDKEVLEAQVQNLTFDNETLTNTIIQKDGVIEFLQAQREVSVCSHAATTYKPKTKEIEDPEKFTGKKDSHGKINPLFDQWKMQVEAKLSTDIHLFDTEQRKIQYVGGRTDGDAYNYIWPRLADQEFSTAQEIIQALAVVYDDPHKKQKARQELSKLYQGDWSFFKYHAEFARITRLIKLPEEDLKYELVSKLNKEYAMAVIGDADLTSDQLVKKLHLVDKTIQATQALKPRGGNSSTNPRTQLGPTQNSTVATTDTSRRFPNQRTAEEKSILIQEKLCIRCCKPGHIISNCPEPKSLPFPGHLKAKIPVILPRPPQVNNVAAEPENQPGNA